METGQVGALVFVCPVLLVLPSRGALHAMNCSLLGWHLPPHCSSPDWVYSQHRRGRASPAEQHQQCHWARLLLSWRCGWPDGRQLHREPLRHH